MPSWTASDPPPPNDPPAGAQAVAPELRKRLPMPSPTPAASYPHNISSHGQKGPRVQYMSRRFGRFPLHIPIAGPAGGGGTCAECRSAHAFCDPIFFAFKKERN